MSPGAELSYLRGATNGIAKIIKKDVTGVSESIHPLTNFDLHVFTPNDNGKIINLQILIFFFKFCACIKGRRAILGQDGR